MCPTVHTTEWKHHARNDEQGGGLNLPCFLTHCTKWSCSLRYIYNPRNIRWTGGWAVLIRSSLNAVTKRQLLSSSGKTCC